MTTRHKVRIIYKSGLVVDYTCCECKVVVATAQNKLTQILWKDARPGVEYMNLDSIAAVSILK